MAERLIPRAITPMKQSLEASCVPTSISMMFSGFGIDISEQTLIDRYFQTVKLPVGDRNSGVTNTNTVGRIVQIINDFGLRESLQLNVFVPDMYKYVNSPEKRYIVEATPRAIRKYGKIFKKGTEVKEFFETLEHLVKGDTIGVYTANARMMRIPKRDILSYLPREVIDDFYNELSDFIRKGHIVGPHGGMTMHARALDGSRMERLIYQPDQEGYVVVDPRGYSWAVSLHSLVRVDSMGVHGDVFDYLFRVSPRERELRPQTYGFRRFLQNLRDLIP